MRHHGVFAGILPTRCHRVAVLLPGVFRVGQTGHVEAGIARAGCHGSQRIHTVEVLHKIMTHSAFLLAAVQVFFLINLVWSAFFGKRAERNPWAATTLEWTLSSPPPFHQFETLPKID